MGGRIGQVTPLTIMVVRGVASWSQEDVESENGERELVFQHLHGPPAFGFVGSKPRSGVVAR